MYRFIINPAAQGWHSKDEWLKIEKELKDNGLAVEVYYTEYPGHAAKLSAELCALEDTELLGVMGGDGTLNEVASGYDCERAIPVFFIPSGSGNDFARGLKLITTKENAAEYLLHLDRLKALPADIGVTELEGLPPRRFMVSSGIGFDAAVCYDMDHSKLKKRLNDLHLGGASYVLLGLKNMLGCPLVSGTLTLDGGRKILQLKKLAFLSAHDLPYEGGGFFFAPKAITGDGKIDLCVVTAHTHLRFILCLFGSVFKGRHIKMKGVYYLRCNKAELHCSRKLAVHTDGEVPGFYDSVTFSSGSHRMIVYQ